MSLSIFNEQLLCVGPWARPAGAHEWITYDTWEAGASSFLAIQCQAPLPSSHTHSTQFLQKAAPRAELPLVPSTVEQLGIGMLAAGPRVEAGEVGTRAGSQPGLPQVPQLSGPPALAVTDVSCSSTVVFSKLHGAEFLVAWPRLQPLTEHRRTLKLKDVRWLGHSHRATKPRLEHKSSEKCSVVSDVQILEIFISSLTALRLWRSFCSFRKL